ncbi:MAG TPA: extracellular solute-binding protein [Spirochaetia bacterium]|nr:extracellular solute-binding protein [Spirochaetia bacterium]
MNSRIKWLVFLVVFLMAVGFSAFAAGTQESAQGKPVTFTIYFHFTPQEARGVVLRDFVARYNEQHAGKVDIQLSYFADWQPMQQKIRTMVAASQPPDVFYFNYNPNDLTLFKSGQLMDFTPYMDAQWKGRFYQSDLDTMTYNGKLLAIPMEQGPVIFYFNTDLLQKAGVASIPRTWDEFFAMADKLKAIGVGAASLFTADDAWHATNLLSYFAGEAGGPKVFSGSLNTKAMVQAATLLQKLFQYGAADAVGGKWAVSVQDFVAGRTAVIADGPWLIGILDGQMQDPSKAVAAPAPRFTATDPSLVVTDANTPWTASVHLSDAQKLAVADFMKTFTSEAVMKDFAIKGKDIFASKLSLSPDEQKQAGAKLATNIQLASTADLRMVQVTRVLKPSTMNQLPSLVEQLALNKMTPADFAAALEQANSQ